MGSLHKIWLVSPEGLAGVASLDSYFAKIFGHRRQDVMAGGDGPLAGDPGWEAYFAVGGLTGCAGPVVADLAAGLKGQGIDVPNIIVG